MRALLVLFLTANLSSQSAMDLFISLLGLWFLKETIQGKNEELKSFVKSGAFKIFVIWFLIVAIGYLNAYSNNGFGSPLLTTGLIIKGLSEFKWILVLCTLIFVFQRLFFEIPKIFSLFAWPLILASVFAIGIFFYGQDPLNANPIEHKWGRFYRSGGFLQSPMMLAHVYVLYLSILIGYFIQKFRDRVILHVNEKILFAATIFCGLAVLLSFTRGVWLGIFAGLLCGMMLLSWRWVVSFLVSTTVFVGSLLGISQAFRERLLFVFQSTSYDSERFWIWKANWEIVKEHFFIGVGYMHNKNLVAEIFTRIGAPEQTLVSHAHNQYLHFLAGTGILGLLAYLAFWIYFILLNLREYKRATGWQQGILLGCFIAQVTFLVGGLTEANFEHTKVRYAVFVVWSLVWVLSQNQKVLKAS